MPPANTTSGTATLITAFPYDYTQTDIYDAGVNYDVWYRFECPTGVCNMGAFAWTNATGPNYYPMLEPLQADLTSLEGITAVNKPCQFAVVAGQTYYLKITNY